MRHTCGLAQHYWEPGPLWVNFEASGVSFREYNVAGWFRSTAAYLGLVDDDGDEQVPAPAREVRSAPVAPVRATERHEVRSTTLSRPVEVATAVPAMTVTVPAEITRIITLHPRSYNDARRIGEEYRLGTPVIINLTEMDDADAKRIVDFAAGLTFGVHGSIEKVTSKVFLLSPPNVDAGAAARAQLEHDGFFNQS